MLRTMKGEEQGRRVPGARALPAIKSLRAAGRGGWEVEIAPLFSPPH